MPNTFTTQVTMRGIPVSRPFVVVMKAGGNFVVAGHGQSDVEGDVTVRIDRYRPGCQYFAMAFDNYGDNFTPGATVEVGDLVAPSEANGYTYEVMSAGELALAEPEWWDTPAPEVCGTATLQARKVFAPSVYGPLALDITLDEHWDKVTLLLILEGSGAVTVVDYSIRGYTPITVGTELTYVTQGNPFDPLGTAVDFAGSGQSSYTIAFDQYLDHSFNTDATMEIWFRPTSPNWGQSNSEEGIVGRRHSTLSSNSREWRLTRYRTVVQFVIYNTNGEAVNIRFDCADAPAGMTHCVAATREGDTIRLYLNGVLKDTAVFSGTYQLSIGSANNLRFGTDYNSRYFSGQIHSFRFTRGVARYTGDSYELPTTNFYAGE